MSQATPDSPNLSKKFLILSIVIIACVGFGIYANSLNGQFLWDDESLVQFNPYIKSWSHLGKMFTSRLGSIAQQAGAFYRPIQSLSYLIDYSLWRLNPFGYHLTNTFWHILAALSVFALVQCLFHNGKLSLLTALLFVVHPIHTEAVSYVSGRADPLTTFFMFIAFALYLRHGENGGVLTLGMMAGSFLLALLSKEISLILPILIFFYHYAFKKPVDKKAIGVLIAALALYGLWRLTVVGTATMAAGFVPTFTQRLPGVFIALTTYFRLLVWPFDLHMEYGGILFQFSEPKATIGIVLLIVVLVFMFLKRNKDPFLFFAIGWFFIALFPSWNLLFAINAYMAEHWLYIPSVGFFLIVARFLVGLFDNPKYAGLAWTITIVIISFFSVLTIMQNRYWNNDISFYKKMLQYAPDSSRLYNNLAKAYHDAGKNDELIDLLKSAIKLEPDNALAHNNLGNAYKGIKKFKEAKRAYQEAIRIDPNHAGPYYNLSTIYYDIEGNTEEAIKLLNKSIKLSPYFSKTYNKLGLIYLAHGENDKAITLLNKALKLNPDDPEIYHNFGYIYIQAGQVAKGEAMYLKAIETDPNYVEAYHDLAIIYHSKGQNRLAIKYCDQAVAMGYVDKQLLESLKPFR